MAKRRKKKITRAEEIRRHRSALKGWETRREQEREEERRRRQRVRQRARDKREAAEKEAKRLRKWRASYKKYLEFRIPKKEREELEVPLRREVVCKVLFDSDETDPREEHFWSNVRYLIGNSISNQLAKILATEGMVTVGFRVISMDEYEELQAGRVEDPSEMGSIVSAEYESDLELEAFWSTYFDHARELLPKDRQGRSGGSLLVVKMQVCYDLGSVSPD